MIPSVINGIIRFFSWLPICGIFFRHIGYGLGTKFEVFMFDDSSPGRFVVRIVHDGYTLMIFFFEALRFKTQAAVFQGAQFVTKVFVNGAGIDNPFCHIFVFVAVLQIIHTSTDFNASKKPFDEFIVAAHGNALIAVVEIVIIKGVTNGEAFNDECWQLRAASPPLLFRIAFDELRINVRPDKGNGLFFEIFWIRDACFGALLGNLFGRFLRCYNAPHFRKGIHVKG